MTLKVLWHQSFLKSVPSAEALLHIIGQLNLLFPLSRGKERFNYIGMTLFTCLFIYKNAQNILTCVLFSIQVFYMKYRLKKLGLKWTLTVEGVD